MACFLVPTAEAIVTSVIAKHVNKTEQTTEESTSAEIAFAETKIPWKRKLSWLNGMLWGGAVLLALEHIWHGEVVFYPPFLTAMNSQADTAEMLQEMSTVGVGMAILVTAVWGVMILIVDRVPALKAAVAGDRA
jgi:hypothetical protein